jgi:hypothetical protein
MKASDAAYELASDDKKPLYQCCFSSLEGVKLSKGLGPCRTDVLYVCSGDESCHFSFCKSCLDMSGMRERGTEYFTSLILLKRNPSALVSLIAFLGLQSVYLPISQNAMMILACHHSVQCEFPTCFSPVSDRMMVALVLAGVLVPLTPLPRSAGCTRG